MSTSTTESVLDGFSKRTLARIAYLLSFLAVQSLSELFATYPALFWLGVAGIVLVFFDAVICARRRWRVVKSELSGNGDDEDPAC